MKSVPVNYSQGPRDVFITANRLHRPRVSSFDPYQIAHRTRQGKELSILGICVARDFMARRKNSSGRNKGRVSSAEALWRLHAFSQRAGRTYSPSSLD